MLLKLYSKRKQAELKAQRAAQGIRRERPLERREADVEARLKREERASSVENRVNRAQTAPNSAGHMT